LISRSPDYEAEQTSLTVVYRPSAFLRDVEIDPLTILVLTQCIYRSNSRDC
jgi:hypothetical protein